MSMLIGLLAAAAAVQAQPAEVAADKDPIVCKRAKEPDVGTRFKPAPVCKKKSVWDLERQMVQRELRQINERGNNPGQALGR